MMKEYCIMIRDIDGKASKPFTRFICSMRPTYSYDQQ